MGGNFIAMVYAVLKDRGIDTKGMDANEAVSRYNALTGGVGENRQNAKYADIIKSDKRQDDERGTAEKSKKGDEYVKDLTDNENKSKILPIKATVFAGKNSRQAHEKHVKEVGAKNFKEYEQKAREFLNSDRGELYTYREGKQRRYCRYDERTNEYAVCREDGKLITYYFPINGKKHVVNWIKKRGGKIL